MPVYFKNVCRSIFVMTSTAGVYTVVYYLVYLH